MTARIGRARALMLVGVLLLAIAAGLVIWDGTGDNRSDDPVTITGDPDSP